MVDESRWGDLWMRVHYTADKPAVEPLPLGKEWQTLYEQDMAAGGLSFYMDRLLARPGVDPSLSSDSGLMTRGRALYTKGTNDSGLMTEFGFGGVMRYVKGDQPGYTLQINGQRAADFQESTARRVDYPSYWTSRYTGTAGTDSEGLRVTLRRFITDYNVAVTVLDITNATDGDKTVEVSLQPPASCDTLEGDTYTGGIWVDYRNIDLRVSLDGGRAADGELVSTLTLAAGETATKKAQMGFIDPKEPAALAEYETYAALDGQAAFARHVQAYNAWWGDNIPYMEVPDPAIQKMIAYRWWITRFNMADASTYNYPFPTAMEGVFGYNNAIVNAIPWQLDEMRYLRSPLNSYGTWADAIFAASGGIYWDNPAGLWGHKPQHYISKAGWETYKVHGGGRDFLAAAAAAGEGDVLATRDAYDPDGDGIYGIQYDAWDADTASLAIPGEQERIDTASLAYANAAAVSEMYAAAGLPDKAETYGAFAENIRTASLSNAWDDTTQQFLMKMADTGEWNPFRDINNYYAFMVGMVPAGEGYEAALGVFGQPEEFPFWPMYISNSSDYETIQASPDKYTARTRNYSAGAISLTLKLFGEVIRDYDADNITGAVYGDLLENYTRLCYVNGNTNYPDTNEFFSGDPDNNPYRSWIHHNWHSQYNTLIIEDVMGLQPRADDVIELHPVDVGWDSFRVSGIRYHGSDLAIVYDKEEGCSLYLDGELAASVSGLCHFTWDAKSGQVDILDDSGAAVLDSVPVSGFRTADQVTYTAGRVAEVIDAVVNYEPGDEIIEKEPMPAEEAPAHDGSYKLETAVGWENGYNLDFGDNQGGDQTKRAQMFVAAEGGRMTGLQVMIQRKDAAADVTVELYEADEDGRPGRLLTAGSIERQRVSTGSMQVYTAPLEYTLEKGKAYYVALGQADGGEGLYCWALSSADLTTATQASQTGYDGALSSYKIQGNGNLVDESSIGDYYLEVFYEAADAPAADRTELEAALEQAAGLTESDYPAAAWAILEAAAEAAKNLPADAGQAAVDAAAADLLEALDGLYLAAAAEAVPAALESLPVSGETTEADLLAAARQAAGEKVSVEVVSFEKTDAAVGQAGRIDCTLSLACGRQRTEVEVELSIPRPGQTVIPGDLDKDGDVDIMDVMMACRVLARKNTGAPPTGEEVARGDLTGDGKVAIEDIMAICRKIAAGA
ncbi:MAG TPA: dockerin type I repeat-containing protein [Firmicutes bacterium]|nr:dockerin type I repeat-containing protein [Bacillota bacterium]